MDDCVVMHVVMVEYIVSDISNNQTFNLVQMFTLAFFSHSFASSFSQFDVMTWNFPNISIVRR